MEEIGLESARSGLAHSLDEARRIRDEVGLPCVLRPSFTLGGSGGGIAYNREEFDRMVATALELCPVHSVLVEESVIGWKEYEMEVMRDGADNAVIVCSIENFDPMGVHTGDSITVAPAQTLTDKEYQRMRDASLAILRKIGVETGGSNVQFAVDPRTGRMIVIEMNPRVSRSSALASKATGFPIAKIAAKLAVGFRLDEIRNDITRETPACFEPTIDYVVTKVPRWAFEKFPEADPVLTTQMKSVGEVMAIGRTFKESLQKALRGLEVGRFGLGCDPKDLWGTPRQPSEDEIKARLATPNAERVWSIRHALLAGPLRRADPRADGDRPLVPGEHRGAGGAGGPAPRGARPRRGRRRACSARPSGTGSPTGSSRRSGARPRARSAATASAAGSTPSSSWSTPAPPSSRRSRPTTTRPTSARTRRGSATSPGWSSWAAAPTGSARGSSSTTAAARPPSRCRPTATRWSWSTRTPRP